MFQCASRDLATTRRFLLYLFLAAVIVSGRVADLTGEAADSGSLDSGLENRGQETPLQQQQA